MEDKLLVWRCKRGSREALRQVYEKYHVDLLKLAIMLTGDVNVAEDAVHDVFVRFAQSMDRLTLRSSLKGYLIVSTVNSIRSWHRRRQGHDEQGLDEAAALPARNRAPEQWAIMSEQLDILRRAMAQLPYEQREAVALHLSADMTFRRIAQRQNTPVSTAQGRYRYGIAKLRSVLNGDLSP